MTTIFCDAAYALYRSFATLMYKLCNLTQANIAPEDADLPALLSRMPYQLWILNDMLLIEIKIFEHVTKMCTSDITAMVSPSFSTECETFDKNGFPLYCLIILLPIMPMSKSSGFATCTIVFHRGCKGSPGCAQSFKISIPDVEILCREHFLRFIR